MAVFVYGNSYFSPNANSAGGGYFAGTSPNGLVLNAGVPAQRVVLVLDEGNNLIVAKGVSSAVDGTYRIDGLNPNRTFKLICVGQNGDNDLIWSGVRPRPY